MTTTSVVESSRSAILSWFTGVGRAKASAALDMLAQCEKVGYWLPKMSRSVMATLTKANVAINIGRSCESSLARVGDYKTPHEKRGTSVSFILCFAHFWDGSVDFDAVREAATDTFTKTAIDRAKQYVSDHAGVAALLKQLDATRPAPVITYLQASPTVTKLLESLGLAGQPSTIHVVPVRWDRIEYKKKDGQIAYMMVATLLWPENTVHGASRYDHTHANDQCQACGHAIKNPFNWVPLLIDNTAGIPHSLWVGTDCARTLFGVKVTGGMEIAKPTSAG